MAVSPGLRAVVTAAVIAALGWSGLVATPATAAPAGPSSAAATSVQAVHRVGATTPTVSYIGLLCATSRFSLPVLRNTSSSRRGTRIVQTALREVGYNPGPVDGIYGPITRRTVRAFQRDWGLIVDGVTGPQTWGKLQTLICTLS